MRRRRRDLGGVERDARGLTWRCPACGAWVRAEEPDGGPLLGRRVPAARAALLERVHQDHPRCPKGGNDAS